MSGSVGALEVRSIYIVAARDEALASTNNPSTERLINTLALSDRLGQLAKQIEANEAQVHNYERIAIRAGMLYFHLTSWLCKMKGNK